MKALDYKDNVEFKAFLSVWKEEEDIPYVLLDWLLENELYSQAECIRYYLNIKPRRRFAEFTKSRLYPWCTGTKWIFFVYDQLVIEEVSLADEVLVSKVKLSGRSREIRCLTFNSCIITLLDSWISNGSR